MEANRISLKIGGRQYPIKGAEPVDYLFNVGAHVDKTISDITKSMPYLSTEQAAVIAALNIADELFKLRKALDSEWTGGTVNTAKVFAPRSK